MNKLKEIAAALTAVSCFLFMSACYPSGGNLLSTEDNAVISEQINEIVSDNNHLEIEVQLPENITELPKVNVKVMDWDVDKLKELFLTGRTNLKYDEGPCDFFPNDKLCGYTQGKVYWFFYEPGRLTAEDRASPYGYGTLGARLNHYRFEDFFNEDSISVLPKETAVNMCTSLLEKVGITNYSKPKIFAITADKVNQFWKDDGEEFEEWTKDDEIYLIQFPIEYNYIPLTVDEMEGESLGAIYSGSHIDFIVTKDKVFSLSAWRIFSPEYELGENVKINCSAENALKIAAERYGGISIGERNIKITDCELVYVPYEYHDEKNFTLVPMWKVVVCSYRNTNKISEMGIRDSLFIDAQTGNVVIW